MTLGERFRFVRGASGHTQESLASESGVSRTTIARIENDAQSPTVQILSALLKGCDSDLGAFLNIDQTDNGTERIIWKLRAVLDQGGEAATVIRWAVKETDQKQLLPAKPKRGKSSKKARPPSSASR